MRMDKGTHQVQVEHETSEDGAIIGRQEEDELTQCRHSTRIADLRGGDEAIIPKRGG